MIWAFANTSIPLFEPLRPPALLAAGLAARCLRADDEQEALLAVPELTMLSMRRVVERYPHWVALARQQLAFEQEREGDLAAGVRRPKPARLDPDWYRMVAAEYRHHLEAGEPAPVSAIARSHQVTVSAASRWVKGARERGFLEAA